jgi:hypothetical protein
MLCEGANVSGVEVSICLALGIKWDLMVPVVVPCAGHRGGSNSNTGCCDWLVAMQQGKLVASGG